MSIIFSPTIDYLSCMQMFSFPLSLLIIHGDFMKLFQLLYDRETQFPVFQPFGSLVKCERNLPRQGYESCVLLFPKQFFELSVKQGEKFSDPQNSENPAADKINDAADKKDHEGGADRLKREKIPRICGE